MEGQKKRRGNREIPAAKGILNELGQIHFSPGHSKKLLLIFYQEFPGTTWSPHALEHIPKCACT